MTDMDSLRIPAPFGPVYPDLPSSKKWRKKETLTYSERALYGQQVREDIRKLNDRALLRALEPNRACPCASGSWESDGKKIAAHVRRKIQAEFEAAVKAERARRTDAAIKKAYEEAMAEKRARATEA